MSRKYKIYDQQDLRFLSYAVVGWLMPHLAREFAKSLEAILPPADKIRFAASEPRTKATGSWL